MHTHNVDTHHNQDKVLKESFSLFKGGSLDFLDKDLTGKVTEILNTEITETATKKAYADNIFKLSSNKGVHSEWETDISESDMMRFASYHIDFARMHGIPFTTVIITTKKPSVTSYISPSMTFTPKIINLKERDADKVLSEIDGKLKSGSHADINELEVIYLPLYGSASGKTTSDLLDKAIKLTPQVAKNDKQKQRKLQDLLILLTVSFIGDEELNKILEANMRILEDSPVIRFLEDRGRSQGISQGISQGREQEKIFIAQNMLQDGEDINKISRITGLEISKITELQEELLQPH
jgi:hypothetical protein